MTSFVNYRTPYIFVLLVLFAWGPAALSLPEQVVDETGWPSFLARHDMVWNRLPEDSVSILPDLLGTAKGPVREATVHQSLRRDLAIRQGPWKLIFFGKGGRELYNLQTDLSETKNVAGANPEVVGKLTKLIQKYMADGRSTVGVPQKNEAPMSVDGGSGEGKRKDKKQKK
jgi:hypothetical protein